MATQKPIVSARSAGLYIALGDLLLSIVGPLIVFGLWIHTGRGIYEYPQVTVELVALVALLVIWLYFLGPYVSRVFLPVMGFLLALIPRLRARMFTLLGLVYLVCAVLFVVQGLSLNRYDDVKASENLSATAFVTLLFIFKTFVSSQVFYCLLTGRTHPRSRAYWMMVLAATFLSIDGLAQTMLAGLIFCFVVLRDPFRALLSSAVFRRPLSLIAMGVLAAMLWVAGIGIKSGSFAETAASLRDREFVEHHVSWLVDRVSTLYFAAGYAVNASIEDPDVRTQARSILVNQTAFRLCVITSGVNCSRFKDEYGSLGRFNYVNIRPNAYGKAGETAGASAGVLGSAAYLVPLFWIPVIVLLFYSAVAAVVDAAAGKVRFTPTLLALMVYGYLLRGLFLDPSGFLNPISPPFIGLLAFMLASAQFYHLRAHAAPGKRPAVRHAPVPALGSAH